MTSSTAALSVIVPTWNTRELLAECLASIVGSGGGVVREIVVVDNASTDGTIRMLQEEFPAVRLLRNDTNRGFGCAVNQAAAVVSSPYMLVLNSDARLVGHAAATMVELMERQPRAAVVGARLVNVDGTFQASHMAFPTLRGEFLVLSGLGRLWWGAHYPSHGPEEARGPHAVEWVPGACLLIRRAAFAAVGGFDPRYFMYAEEVDLCYRLRLAGWETWYHPAATVVHLGRGSTRDRPTAYEVELYRGRVRFLRTHRRPWQARVLVGQIYAFTAIKRLVHGVARLLSRGRWGRPVVPLRDLALLAEKPS